MAMQTLLEEVIEKLTLAGEEVGISTEDMIQMLKAGITLETLLDLICGLHAFKDETRYPAQRIM